LCLLTDDNNDSPIIIRPHICSDTYDKLLSVLWYIRYIFDIVVIRKKYCCQCWDTQEILLSVLWYNTDNNLSYVSEHWQQCVLPTTTCITCQNTNNNITYVSQQYQQYVLCITTLTTICLTHHNTDRNMSYVSQHWNIVVSLVIRKIYCCQCYDA
jgi:hypothetical protein